MSNQAVNAPDLRYPVGRFDFQAPVPAESRPRLIDDIAAAPDLLRQAVAGLNDSQLDTPYREGGWTVRQVVHHVPDSHMNSYVRFRLALTEDEPAVKPYDESRWADLHDSLTMPPEASLALLENLHLRWVELLRSLSDSDFQRTFRHPEIGLVRLDTNLALYAWHGRHHTAHITGLRRRMGW
jgi:uncharacterized damage-inducible protein DinB